MEFWETEAARRAVSRERDMAVTMRLAVNADPGNFMEYLNGLTTRLKILTSPEEKLMEQKIAKTAVDQTWVDMKTKGKG